MKTAPRPVLDLQVQAADVHRGHTADAGISVHEADSGLAATQPPDHLPDMVPEGVRNVLSLG